MRRFLLIAALGALAWAAPATFAQVSLSQEIITASAPLTEAQRQRVEEFVASRVESIASGDPADVARARNDLTQPPRTPGATAVFRRAYADSVRAGLRPILASPDEYRASNALSVLPFLLTVESLDELAENASRRKQPRDAVRIMAARMLAISARNLAAPNPPFTMNGAEAEGFARKLKEAALEETSWVALAELGSAVAEIGNWKSLEDAYRDKARQELRRILEREVELARTDPKSEAIRAIQRTLGDLQAQLLEMRGASRTAYGQQLQPLLKSIRELAAKPPTNLPEGTLRAYEKAVKSVDLIDRMLAS